ncbi:MAG: pyridoxal phosphate-dependent aminotransferase [Gammaproteobacteria bacterium]|nr:pyridoxal phosphate-dependent aminotransferase [Gammaproteobacteria bacterium]
MTQIPLTHRVNAIQPSPTLAVTGRARELREQGKDVIGLGAGEPDFDTPDHIKEAAIAAIRAGQTKYTAVDGTPELKKAIVEKFRRENDLEYALDQVLVSSGAKHSLFNLFLALVEEGSEVIIPAPYWVSYPDMVTVVGGTPVIVTAGADQHFKITPGQLENAITDRTRLLVMNSPSNPTGVMYSLEELEALGEVLRRHPHVYVATDDIYEHIQWTQPRFVNLVNAAPDLYERSLVVNGVSKVYAMTGWRIGYAAGPKELIGAMKKVQSQSTSNPASISQAASAAALSGDQSCVVDMVTEFQKRGEHVVERLNRLKGVTALPSDGTFYSFPDFSTVIEATDGISNDVELASHLLDTAEVALVPGSAFGLEGHLRLSYATDLATLDRALDRLEKVVGVG